MVRPSTALPRPHDALDGPGKCGDGATALPGVDPGTIHAQGRCGPGPRLPLLMISPWAKANYVDHTLTDQTSTLRLIEDLFLKVSVSEEAHSMPSRVRSWNVDFSKSQPQNARALILDPDTGLVKKWRIEMES